MIVNYADLGPVRTKHRGETIAYASGCFDILHPGHIKQLEFVKSLGDIAVIGITPDARIRERKGPQRPINPESVRATVIDALRCVDYCFITPEQVPDTPIIGHAVMRSLQPDLLVTHDRFWRNDEDWLLQQGTRIIPGVPAEDTSTTQIIETILERYATTPAAVVIPTQRQAA